jgi:serine/threonine-protein kinase RIO1
MKKTGMEIFFTIGSEKESSVYYVFESQSVRDNIVRIIEELPVYPHYKYENIEIVCEKWSKKEISNLEYLLYLNSEGDRYVCIFIHMYVYMYIYICMYVCI